jgi:hypothetical protein
MIEEELEQALEEYPVRVVALGEVLGFGLEDLFLLYEQNGYRVRFRKDLYWVVTAIEEDTEITAQAMVTAESYECEVPEYLRQYFDTESLANDLAPDISLGEYQGEAEVNGETYLVYKEE